MKKSAYNKIKTKFYKCANPQSAKIAKQVELYENFSKLIPVPRN